MELARPSKRIGVIYKRKRKRFSLNAIAALLYFVSVTFVFPFSDRKIVYILQLLCLIISIINNVKIYKRLKVNTPIKVCSIIFLFLTIFLFSFSRHSQFYVIKAFLPILIMLFWAQDGIGNISKKTEKPIWFILFCLFLAETVFIFLNPGSDTVFASMFEDRNFRDFIIALFLIYSLNKKRYLASLLLFVLRVFASFGRGFILFIGLFFIIRLLKLLFPAFFIKFSSFLKKRGVIFVFVVLSVLFLVLFSYYWVNVTAANGVVEYKQGLNDMSNLERFNANIYAVEELFSSDKFAISGYGGELHMELFGEDYSNREYVFYHGIVLVQPHCSVLNFLMCFGIVPGFIYLASFSNVLRKTVSFFNVDLLIPFIVYTLFLWIYPNNGLEMFFVLLLMLINRIKGVRDEKTFKR